MTTFTQQPIESRPTTAYSIGLVVAVVSGLALYYALDFDTKYIRRSFGDYVICGLLAFVGGSISGIIATFLAHAWGLRGAPIVQTRATVTAKYFSDSSLSVGTGVGAGGTAVVTTSVKPEQYTVEVRFADTGKKARHSVSEENFDALEVGDHVVLSYRISRTTGEPDWADEIALAQ